MATTKTLNTKIKLRYDTFNNWTTNNPILLKGEVAVVEVPIPDVQNQAAEPDKLKDGARPSILFKIGVNTSTVIKDNNNNIITPDTNGYHFNDLPWASSLAADVHAWAKKSQGDAADITITDIGNKITATTVEGALQELATAISAIEGGDNEVSLASLKEAIDTLNGDANTDGSVAKAVADEAARIDAVTGTPDSGKTLQGEIDDVEAAITTLNGNSSTNGSVAKAVADEAARIDAVTGTPDSGKTLQQEIDAVEADITTLNGDVNTTGSVAKSINDAITGLNLGTTYAAKAYETKVDTLIGSDTGSSVRTIAEGVVASVVDNAPDAFNTLKEIADWISTAGDNEQTAADMVTDINALKTKTELGTYDNNGTPTEYATVKAYVEAVSGNLDTRVTAAEGDIDDLETAVGVLNGNASTNGSVAKAVADEAARIDAITGTPDSGKTLQGEIDDVETAIGVLNGDNTTAGSVAKAVKDAVDAIDITVAANGQGETNKVLTGFEIENGGLKADSVKTTTLAAIATTGNVNDLVQTQGDTLILDGGNANG